MTDKPAPKASGQIPEESTTVERASSRRMILFALTAVLGALLISEVLLRLAGFRFEPVPILVDSTWGSAQVDAMNESVGGNVFERDDLLFWRLKAGARLQPPDKRVVNKLGLLDEPVAVPKPAKTCRILCLGDSCTAEGPVSYSDMLETKLNERPERGRSFDVVNAGVFGYTSLQGLRLFDNRLDGLAPDLVTAFFGWNDHYLTYGYPDKLLSSHREEPAWIIQLLRHIRLYQATQKCVHYVQMKSLSVKRKGGGLPRVAPEEFRDNLDRIVDLARKRGARVVLMTAPSNHSPGNVPAAFLEGHLAENDLDLIQRHQEYVEIVRNVGEDKKVEVLDLAKEFNTRDKSPLFRSDGVHFTEPGRELISELLFRKLVELKIVNAPTQ